jgi:undecaprenyl-diphosphatase
VARFVSLPASARAERHWLMAAGIGGGILALAAIAYHLWPGIDEAVTPADPPRAVQQAARALAAVGTERPILIGSALAAAGLLLARRPWGALRVGTIPYATTLAAGLVKSAFGRARPPDALVGTAGASFPSGHAAYAAALGCLLAWFAFRYLKGRWWVTAALAAGAGWAFLMALDRVMLRAHYLTDVVGGAGLGVAVAGTGLALSNRLQRRYVEKRAPPVSVRPHRRAEDG